MKPDAFFRSVAHVVAALAIAGCAEPPPAEQINNPPDSEGESVESVPLEQFQVLVDAYAESLIDHDVESFRTILTSEHSVQSAKTGMDVSGFLEKQRASLFSTFQLESNARPSFAVVRAVASGNTFEVTLSLNGKELTKPTYFVRENGVLKLSIAAPGFSRDLKSTSNYQVHNIGAPGALMLCDNNSTFVDYYQTKKVNCYDHCGYWSGTYFVRSGGTLKMYCDWNSWGDDVIIDGAGLEGWRCDDPC